MGASAKSSFYKARAKHSKKMELMLSKFTPFLALFYFDLVKKQFYLRKLNDLLKMGCMHSPSQIKCAVLEHKRLGSL